MNLWLCDRIARLKITPEYFFRLAHQWRFNHDAEVSSDAIAYRVAGIVPQYVKEYVTHIQEKEAQNAVQTLPREH